MVTKKNIVVIVLLAALAGVLWWFLFPSDARQVRSQLKETAKLVSVPTGESLLARATRANNVADNFSPAPELILDRSEIGRPRLITSREEIRQYFLGAHSQLVGTRVELLDITVAVDTKTETAHAELTAKVTHAGQSEVWAWPVRVEAVKVEGEWLVSRVETFEVIER